MSQQPRKETTMTINITSTIRAALNSGASPDAIRAEVEEAIATWTPPVSKEELALAEIEIQISEAASGPDTDRLRKGTEIHQRIRWTRDEFGSSERLVELTERLLLELFDLPPETVAEQVAKLTAAN